MDEELIMLVKRKREFSELPDSIIQKALELNKKDVRLSRAFLRKYFGVFMTNKVLKLKNEKVLGSHISSKKRDYSFLYSKIHSVADGFETIIDLGCGANSFSYPYIDNEFGRVNYIGLEAVGQIVSNANSFFEESGYNRAFVLQGDLFDLAKVREIIKYSKKRRLVLVFQVVDALESVERNFSKKFFLELKKNLDSYDCIVVSNPLKSISGQNKFTSKREWLKKFLQENFRVLEEFDLFDENYIVLALRD